MKLAVGGGDKVCITYLLFSHTFFSYFDHRNFTLNPSNRQNPLKNEDKRRTVLDALSLQNSAREVKDLTEGKTSAREKILSFHKIIRFDHILKLSWFIQKMSSKFFSTKRNRQQSKNLQNVFFLRNKHIF